MSYIKKHYNESLFLSFGNCHHRAFLVITPTGYTMHYYAGTERFAAQVGKGRFGDLNYIFVNPDSVAAKLTAVNGIATYLASYASPKFTYLNTLPILSTTEKEIYYYHTDHLGSSAWITDSLGVAVQHLAYLPWGEPFVTQKTGNFNPTYTFSGKERDEETGYSYFGQRFYDSQLSIWLSADPMRGKYPSLSPFVYCANNPVKIVDPDGRDYDIIVNDDTQTITIKANYYTSEENREKLQKGINEWNNMSGKYSLKRKKDNETILYTINFELSIVDNDNGLNSENKDYITNIFEINNSSTIPEDARGITIEGNKILVRTNAPDRTITHEIGHTLGIGEFNGGVMESGGDSGKISKNNIIKSLEGADIETQRFLISGPYQIKKTYATSKTKHSDIKGYVKRKR